MANHDDDKHFSHRLIELMEARRMTVREAAEAAGVAVSSLQNWRAGHQPSNFIAIKRLAEALGTTLEYLLIGDNGSPLERERLSRPSHQTLVVRGDISDGTETFSGVVEMKIRRRPSKS